MNSLFLPEAQQELPEAEIERLLDAAEAIKAIQDDECTFGGSWTDQIGSRFDIPVAAVRRRIKGMA